MASWRVSGALYVVRALDISGNARACDKIPLFLSRPAEIRERAPGPVRGTAIDRAGLAMLVGISR